jgi:hypothetical protein
MEKLVNSMTQKPNKLFDRGSEFNNPQVKRLLEQKGIIVYTVKCMSIPFSDIQTSQNMSAQLNETSDMPVLFYKLELLRVESPQSFLGTGNFTT